jgi:hypothetical protein
MYPSSELKSKQSKKIQHEARQQIRLLQGSRVSQAKAGSTALASCFAYTSTLKIEATCSSETLTFTLRALFALCWFLVWFSLHLRRPSPETGAMCSRYLLPIIAAPFFQPNK